ncbi:hypothetical protein SLEP1_g21197 [Rubroshorea leprosula]|uniref:Disease resistance protein RGA3 n=1 Tax=Rubroshorea leprosula TaxID=152421 RepID=A0AAV5JAH9_9ROSI|nr:hypothetical protein SLEP1_g21197 [Rubroshorea leprosula]
MADAIISLILDMLKTTIVNKAKEEVKLLVGVKEEVKNLERNLDLIQSVLVRAERKKRTDELVKKWLDRLKEASFDMEDALDEWRTAVELEIHGAQNQKKVLCNFISCFSFDRLGARRKIAVNIKEINRKLDEIVKEKDRYELRAKEIELPRRQESTSFLDASKLYGRDGVKTTILSYLWGEKSKEEAGDIFQTISIVGMGGMGKTAVAQLVYNDQNVKKHFDNVIWVCVSNPFEEKTVAKAIIQGLETLNLGQASGLESNPLQVLLHRISNSIKGKKFLLILDDVWAANCERWESFKAPLRVASSGSRILVTTRDSKVAAMMGSNPHQIIRLEILKNEECWLICRDIAFEGKDKESCKILEETFSKKIGNRCKGLPLVAKTLGSLLKSKRSKEEWQSLLDSNLTQSDIFASLLLSYYDLLPPVRRCFLYFATFPKNFLIWQSNIIGPWMALGFLGSDGDADLESKGEEYLRILVDRFFFQHVQVTKDGHVVNCRMHEVVNDFCQYLAENEFATKEVKSNHFTIDWAKHRHLGVTVDEQRPFPSSISGAQKLRALTTFTGEGALTCEALRNLFNQCRRLRVLDFAWPDFQISHLCEEIPEEIGKLIHLRYLDLAHSNRLERLPEALCDLHNLQYLNLNGCKKLKQLPNGIAKLINLRLLRTNGCFALTHYPKGIQKLTSLRKLWGAIARADCNDAKEFSLADLGNLKYLRSVWMKVVGNSIDKGEARKALLQNVRELRIYLAGNIMEEDIIEVLDPHSQIRSRKFYKDFVLDG